VLAENARNRLVAEAAVIIVVVVAAWAIIYGPLLETCCGAVDLVVVALLWSASQVGGLVTGATKDPGRGAVLIGLIIEALAIWALCRWVWSRRKKGG
jgi:hypothetical protein